MSRRTVASCLLAGCRLKANRGFYFTALHLYIFTALSLLLPVAGRAEWNPWHPDPIIEYHYSYDGVGNITKIEDSVNNSASTFTYDEVDRLTQAVGPYGQNGTQQTQTYSYDAVGNISGTPNLPTDGNGNVIQLNGKIIEYDYENRPIKITETATGVITEFGYDYSGQRVWKAVSSSGATSETLYVGNIYEVHISSTGVETRTAHIYAGSLRVASRVTDSVGSRTFYYLGDHLGSTRMMTDALGQVVQDISYEPWGSTVAESSTTYKANYKYTGQMLDDSTGLYYYGARYYDPQLKRFITPDTIVQSPYDPQSLNRYAYCRNNPLVYIDPTGHWTLRNFLRTTVLPIAMVAVAVYLGPAAGWEAYGMLGMAGSAANVALTKGANFGDVLHAGVTGFFVGAAAGAVASGTNSFFSNMPVTFNGVGLGAGASEFIGAVAAGASGGYVAGAGATLLYGGNLKQANEMGLKGAKIGAVTAGIAKTMEYMYEGWVGYEPDRNPGQGTGEKGLYGDPVRGADNTGAQGWELDPVKRVNGPGPWDEGGKYASRAGRIKGVNAAAGPHDKIQTFIGRNISERTRTALNVPMMFPAAAFSTPTLIYGPQGMPIITEHFIDRQ